MNRCPSTTSRRSRKLAQRLLICTFNVRSIKTNVRLADLEEALRSIKFDIVGLAETRIEGIRTCSLTSGNVLYTSGTRDGTRTSSGVGFYVRENLNKYVSGASAINERIFQLSFKWRNGRTLRITQVHAPHSGYPDEDYDVFLQQLNDSLCRGKWTHDIIMGDFNAIVGPKENGETRVGIYGTGQRNERGAELSQFCEHNGINITSTFFRKPKERKWTWRSPNGKVLNEIDYIMSARKESIKNVNTLVRFNAGSDHRLLRAEVDVKHKIFHAHKKRPITPYLNGDQFRSEVERELVTISEHTDIPSIMDCIKKAAERATDHEQQLSRISDRTKALARMRRDLHFGVKSDQNLLNYVNICKAYRCSLELDLCTHREKVLETAIQRGRMKQGWKELANKRSILSQIKKADGSIVSSTKEVLECIGDFYSRLYTSTNGTFSYSPEDSLINGLSTLELVEAARTIKANSAPGVDGVSPRAMKLAFPLIANIFSIKVNKAFAQNDIPADFAHARTILLHKMGDILDVGNYRPISLLTTSYKIVTKALARRIEAKVMEQLPKEQAGFRKRFSTCDHIHTVNMLIEKSHEWNLPLHLCFIDFKKAFDTLELNSMWEALDFYGIDKETIRIVKQLYSAGTSSVTIGAHSIPFEVQRGVRQGDSLSPLMFILCLQYALSKISWGTKGVDIGNQKLSYLAYADDVVIMSRSTSDLKWMTQEIAKKCKNIGLKINEEKSKWMSTETEVRSKLKLNGKEIEKVEAFIYLGQQIQIPRQHGQEVGRRISSGWYSFQKAKTILTNKKFPMYLKRKYFHMCVIPALLYGCESWSLTKAAEERLAIAQRKMERRMLGVRLIDKLSSELIRRRTKLKDVVQEYRRRKWKFAKKLANWNDNRWSTQITFWKPDLKRPLGRPRIRWEDDFRKHAGTDWTIKVKNNDWNLLEVSFILRNR